MAKRAQIGKGGDGGKIVIFAKEINGNGSFIADGGSGSVGGRGGEVHLFSEKNNFSGSASVKGGKSTGAPHRVWWKRSEVIFSIITLLIAAVSIPWWPSWFHPVQGGEAGQLTASVSQSVSTTSLDLGGITGRYNQLKTSLDKQGFLDQYMNSVVVGRGTFSDIGKTDTDYLLSIKTFNGWATCEFDKDWGKRLNLLSLGQEVSFSGLLQGHDVNGSFWITNCVLTN